MKITARPHPRDIGRMQVTFNLPSAAPGARNRVRKTAPAGILSEEDAVKWGEKVLGEVLRENMLAPAPIAMKEEPKNEPKTPTSPKGPTLERFWVDHVETYLETLDAPGTALNWRQLYKDHLRPALGKVRLDEITRDVLRKLDSHMLRTMKSPQSRNTARAKLKVIIRLAKEEEVIPETAALVILDRIKREPVPKRTRPVHRGEQLETILQAARDLSPKHEVALRLMVECDLRVSEVCALRWEDIDFRRGFITISRNISGGVEHVPKGKEAKPVGMSPELADALRKLERKISHVLVRDDRPERLTRHCVTHLKDQIETQAGVKVLGPHRLRASGITHLRETGLPPMLIQSQARHADFRTTQAHYISVDRERDAMEVARHLANRSAAIKTAIRDTDPGSTPADRN